MSVKKLKAQPVLQQDKGDPIYCIIVDGYLQPKQIPNFEEKSKELLRFDGVHSNEINLKQRWHLLKQEQPIRRVVKVSPVNGANSSEYETQRKSGTIIKLLSFALLRKVADALGRSKVEDTRIRKSETGFEVYCELASVHGFKNLVGATTCQRIFWFFILCLMLYSSIFMLWRTIGLHADDPTILYVQTTTGTIWGSTFPSVNLCSLNRISKDKIEELLKEDPQAAEQIRPYLHAVLYNTLPVSASPSDFRLLQMYLDSKNYTHSEFLRKISPDCMSQLLRCKLHGQIRPCSELFQRVENQHGFCCLFIYHTIVHEDASSENNPKMHSNRFGYKWGLTVLIDPQVEDYYASRHKLAGYQIFTRAPHDYAAINVEHKLAFPSNEIHIHVTPLITLASPYVGWHSVENRHCYMPNERKLLTFANYTQVNCISECRSRKIFNLCGCVPPLWPRADNWTVCTLAQASCVISNNVYLSISLSFSESLALLSFLWLFCCSILYPTETIIYSLMKLMTILLYIAQMHIANFKNIHHLDVFNRATLPGNKDYKTNPKAEKYDCMCYSICDFTLYRTNYDVTPLDRNYSINDLEFYRGIELKDHLVAHIFYADMADDVMRLDVHNNWLTYFGIFGGITSLHLGYSFISGFEIIFFLLVRLISIWLMRRNNKQ